ncbi:hypothetical protein FKG94_03210 [Exilibacterium tricleocarpae]|uniref:Uncharacterized protein n=1 Tax=Exilibacterium tricleocarpae TaxID=2591008 RepID=A0A545U6W0_9GAMM|nr:hypothetical protein [Exilibacterium tricleocarpae]TQV85212.1 hypothetical protein FKG94_03210 [Exilibacterium tricleocarpae]
MNVEIPKGVKKWAQDLKELHLINTEKLSTDERKTLTENENNLAKKIALYVIYELDEAGTLD